MAVVALLQILRRRERGFHWCQRLAPVVHEEVQGAQHVILRIGLSELAQRSLEVVGLHGQVVVVGGRGALVLVQRRHALGIGAAVIHVVAQEVRARTQLHECHRVGILGIEVRPAVIGCRHTATQLAGKIGIVLVALVLLRFLLPQLLGSDGRRRAESLEVESLVVVAVRLAKGAVPETVGIVAIERQHLAEGYGRSQFRPAGAGIEGQVEARVQRNLLQRHQILAATTILVVELGSDDGTAVLPL